MKFKESEKVELKKSTSELKEAIISIVAILNKNQESELPILIRSWCVIPAKAGIQRPEAQVL